MREGGGVGSRQRAAVWCAWSAALAAMPYFRASLDAIPMVVAPGQAGDVPVAVALLFVLAWGVVLPGGDEPRPARMARRAVGLIGLAATAALVVVEVVLCVNRGIPYLDDAQVAVYETVGALELPLATLALSGWALWGSSLGIDATHDGGASAGPVAQKVVSTSAVPLFVAFAVGSLWPCAGMLGALVPWAQPAAYSLVGGALSAVAALLMTRLACSHGVSLSHAIESFLAGNLVFVLVRAIDREIVWEGLGELLPSPALFGCFAALMFALVVVSGLILWFRTRRRHETSLPEAPDAPQRQVLVGVLQSRARKPLTDRELVVLERTALGDTASAIAEDLGLAEATVASYRHRGYEKLGVSGAEELRVLAADVETPEGSTGEEGGVIGANATLAIPDLRLRPRYALFLLVLIALPMIPWPDAFEGPRGYWIYGIGRVVSYVCAMSVLLLGIVFRSFHVDFLEREGNEPTVISMPLRMSLVLLALASGLVTYQSWCGYGGYEMAGMALAAILVLLSVGCSSRSDVGSQTSKTVKGILPYLLANVEFLMNETWFLCFPIAVVLSMGLDSVLFEVLNWLYVVRYLLTFFVCIFVLAAAIQKIGRKPRAWASLPMKGVDRTIMYLESRGLGELQAYVLLDLACGYGVREVAERRCTTAATVKSYRQRSYDALGVHSISELRELLSREAGFTRKRKLHPDK